MGEVKSNFEKMMMLMRNEKERKLFRAIVIGAMGGKVILIPKKEEQVRERFFREYEQYRGMRPYQLMRVLEITWKYARQLMNEARDRGL